MGRKPKTPVLGGVERDETVNLTSTVARDGLRLVTLTRGRPCSARSIWERRLTTFGHRG